MPYILNEKPVYTPFDNPAQDLPTRDEMNPRTEPVPPIEAVPMEPLAD